MNIIKNKNGNNYIVIAEQGGVSLFLTERDENPEYVVALNFINGEWDYAYYVPYDNGRGLESAFYIYNEVISDHYSVIDRLKLSGAILDLGENYTLYECEDFSELRGKLIEYNEADVKYGPAYGFVVISDTSFKKRYPIVERTYKFSCDNKAFKPSAISNSIFARALSGPDSEHPIRLDNYLSFFDRSEPNGWEIECAFVAFPQPIKEREMLPDFDMEDEESIEKEDEAVLLPTFNIAPEEKENKKKKEYVIEM